MPQSAQLRRQARASRAIATSVALGATALFAGLAAHMLTGSKGSTNGEPAESALVSLLLTIALIILAWRRSKDSNELLEALEASQRRERKLAYFDELTGLHNRRYLTVEAPFRSDPHGWVLLLLDLDGFKKVNDLHGHEAGDAVLKTVAQRIVQCVGNEGEVVRLGGDEFAVCLSGCYDNARTSRLASDIIAEGGSPIDVHGAVVRVGISVGITSVEYNSSGLSDVLRRGDIAMYEAKRRGKNCAVWFSPEMERARNASSSLANEIRAGILRDEFVPFFQPLLDLPDLKLRGFEALARWHHPSRGVLGPDEFMQVAANSGLVFNLSQAIIRAAVKEASRWPQDLVLSVNLSTTELHDTGLAGWIEELLVQAALPPSRFEVEVCENSLLHESETAVATLVRLRALGISVALEDFGTGYAALARFRELPFDRIKIDRSFVNSMESDGHSAAIVAAIAALGKSLSLPISAEGIEEVSVQKLLVELGATEGQGWLYGDAISGDQAAQLLHGLARPRESSERRLTPDIRAA